MVYYTLRTNLEPLAVRLSLFAHSTFIFISTILGFVHRGVLFAFVFLVHLPLEMPLIQVQFLC